MLERPIPTESCWFTSDQHFGHVNIIRYCNRPFADIVEMDRELIARHNAVVKPDDVVWHLGDFSLSARRVPEVLRLLNGQHYLVCGNHDACYGVQRRFPVHKEVYRAHGFKLVVDDLKLGDWRLCHLPRESDNTRYPNLRPEDDGSWLLCGHVHDRWKQRKKQINVGVDVWNFAPVHMKELELIRMMWRGL